MPSTEPLFLMRRLLHRRAPSWRRTWTRRRAFRIIFLRRRANPSALIYHIYRDVHINAPVTVYNQFTTTSYSHSNNTTTSNITDAFNDNSVSVIRSAIHENNTEETFLDGRSSNGEEEGHDSPADLPRFPGTSTNTV